MTHSTFPRPDASGNPSVQSRMSGRRVPAAQRRALLGGASAGLVGLTLMPYRANASEPKVLNFLNWDTYIGKTTLADFRKATGINVRMSLFADNDELFARFKAGNPGFDVIMPTNDYVERMIKADMLMPLDHSRIPNIKNITPSFMKDAPFDPGRKFSLPYMWGTIGVGYRKSKVKGAIDSWQPLLDSGQYTRRIALMGASQYVLGAALKYLGHSWNSVDPAEIRRAEQLLIAQKKHIKVFADDNGQDLLASGEVDLVQEWNGDILQTMEEDKDIAYQVPKEGSNLWQDCIAIPKGAPHPQNAHAFINFVNEGAIAADIAREVKYATPNEAAKKLLPQSYLKNPAIFPPQSVLDKCESSQYLGEAATRLRDEAWSRVQAA